MRGRGVGLLVGGLGVAAAPLGAVLEGSPRHAGTGFTKMEHGMPVPRGLRLVDWDVPRIFFGREYLLAGTSIAR